MKDAHKKSSINVLIANYYNKEKNEYYILYSCKSNVDIIRTFCVLNYTDNNVKTKYISIDKINLFR